MPYIKALNFFTYKISCSRLFEGTAFRLTFCGRLYVLLVPLKQYLKGQAIYEVVGGFQEVEAYRFREIQCRKLVRFSDLQMAAFTPMKYSLYSFLLDAQSTTDHSAA